MRNGATISITLERRTCPDMVNNQLTIEMVLSGHRGWVSCVKWGGTGFIYPGSHDKTGKIWNAKDGTPAHSLNAHVYWVNHLALPTDFVIRTAYHDHTDQIPDSEEKKIAMSKERLLNFATIQGEVVERLFSLPTTFRCISGSLRRGQIPLRECLAIRNKSTMLHYLLMGY
jgi:ribosome assembly protein 4